MSQPAIAISFDTVFAKSKVYIGRALRGKAGGDLEEYQLWASLALELLGKAALASKHPCLVVDPNHAPSLFVAAGVGITTDVKTIGARTLYDRLKQLVPQFDEPVRAFCSEISERRNSELHSGDVPFKTMKADAWEAKFWHACQIILDSFDSTFVDWIGADEAETPLRIVKAKKDATFAAVMAKIEASKMAFLKIPQKDREKKLLDASALVAAPPQLLFFLNDNSWVQICPSCGGRAYLGGDQIHEEMTEDNFGQSLWETVERTYSADEFACPVCNLTLTGSDEVEAAGMELEHSDTEEREIEYEPDYGNC